jgi:diguanylate cyclase (GGDEF)-like protein
MRSSGSRRAGTPPRAAPFNVGGSAEGAEGSPTGWLGEVAKMALLGLAYYGIALLSLRLALVRGQVTPIWPPTGIALVALLLFGRRLWPGIFVGAFLINAPISPSVFVAAGIAVGNTLAPLLAVSLLRRAEFRPELSRLRDAVAIVILGALLSMTISATVGTVALLLSRGIRPNVFWSTWSVWWTGDAVGVLVVAPFLLSLRPSGPRSPLSWERRMEAVALFASLGVVARLVFESDLHIAYVVFPFLGWAAWRFRQRGAAFAALLASGIAIWAAVEGTGPFAQATLLEKMVNLQVFNASVALCSFVLAAVVAERLEDIEQRRRAEEELAHRALHDPLTDLANRMLFMDRLSHALLGSQRRHGPVALMFLDLDRFKLINDTLGHDVGDQVLSCIANRLQGLLRAGDTGSRFGGDEFVVLCEEVGGERDALDIAKRLCTAVGQPIELGSIAVRVAASVGIALAKGPNDEPEALVRQADAAMYRAKQRGRNRYELFDPQPRVRAAKHLKPERA